jgi:hypothetical protein
MLMRAEMEFLILHKNNPHVRGIIRKETKQGILADKRQHDEDECI